jgi:phosphotransferase system enzyme I (PtsI)
MPELAREGERVFRGIPVSAGVCRAKILVLSRPERSVPRREITDEDVPREIQRLEQALLQTRHEIVEVQRKVSEGVGAADASIFDAHLLVLEDPILIDEVTRLIQDKHVNAEAAFHEFAEKYTATLSKIDDDYLRERTSDLRDVTSRVLNNLTGMDASFDFQHLTEPCIIICDDLPPSAAATLEKTHVLGFATDSGSKTSHTAIMARSLEIPAVVGLQNASRGLKSGSYALLDGFNGVVIINPTDQTLFEYGQLVRKQVDLKEKLRAIMSEPAVTIDGSRVLLSANIEQSSDAELVKACGADGVGLFRTEYLFINRQTLPDEEEQFLAYSRVASVLAPQPVVIRTLDLGGDKFLSHLHVPHEMNPFLGWRAIRFCLEERDTFRTQLRAILRASAHGNIKMMYPMISCLDELNEANSLVDACKAELQAEGKPFNADIEIGVMIEIPSAVLVADALAKRVKFFSIGTNDLIQYSLAVDRLNEKIAHLYEPTHPAILRLIKMTVDAAHRHGIWCGVCGEVAGDPVMATLLLGLGIDDLSATPSLVPSVKFLIRRLRMDEAKQLAEFALNCESGKEILRRAETLARDIAPSLFENQV